MRGWRATAVVGAVLVAAGCADKLSLERGFDIDLGERPTLILPPQSVDQTVTAAVTADHRVSVYVIPSPLGDIKNADEKQLKARATASSENMTTGRFQFKVPAKQETNVVFTAGSKTTKAKVTVKLTN